MTFVPTWFVPLNGRQVAHPLAAFDVEGGGGLEGFVCGALVTQRKTRFYTDRKEMWEDVRAQSYRRTWVFCHGLQYDLPLLEGSDFPLGRMLFTRVNLLWSSYVVGGRKFKIYDSLNLFPHLDSRALGESVGLPQVALSDPLKRQLAGGRPWSFFSESDQERIRSYTIREAEVCYLALTGLQEIALELGGTLRPTIAGISMDIFRRKYQIWPWPVVGPKTNNLARPAYYGGRVENFAYGKVPGVNVYDINSLYPSVQGQARFPHPRYLRLEWQPKLGGDWASWEGVCSCTISVPDRFVPPLPHRFDRRLFFPTGSLRGCWPLAEVRHALETGCVLRSIEWVLGSPVTFNPFHEFVDHLYEKRSSLRASRDARAGLVKLLLNSLYGRWGLNPQGGLYTLRQLDTPGPVDLAEGAETLVTPYGLYAYEPLRDLPQPAYVNVLFAAQIAAAARLKLLDELEYQNESLCYCDTDSIVTRGGLLVSDRLGGWRLESGAVDADLVGPKDYQLVYADGVCDTVVKGVPGVVADDFFREGIARFTRALGIREAIREGRQPAEWVQTYKRRGVHLQKRQPLEDVRGPLGSWCSTRPYAAQELAEVLAGRFPPSDWEGFAQVPLLPLAPELVQAGLELPDLASV